MEKMIYSSAEFAEIIEDTVKSGGIVPLIVTGNSMRPFMHDGKNTVWLRACKETDFKRGEILLFRRTGGAIVLHRIRKVSDDGNLIMNGDAQYWCESIKKEQALAVVEFIETNGKKKACSSLLYRAKIEMWQLLKPLRPYIFAVHRRLKIYSGNWRNSNV